MTGTEGEDWANYQVAAPSLAGLGFVFVKATEGSSYVNPKHDLQVAHVRAGGLVTGHYHFQRPGSPTKQAVFFLAHAKPQPRDVLACDWEDTGVPCADKDAFIRAVKAAQPHLRVVLYCNRDFWLHRDTTSFVGDGLWIADPSPPKGQPRITADWLFHQYGSPGGLDRNYSPLTAAQLRAWAAGTITPQQEDDMTPAQEAKLDKLIALAQGPGNQSYRNATADAASMKATGKHIPDVYGYITNTYAGVQQLLAKVGALNAALAALTAKGGLTAEEVTAAAEAGAQAALAQLADALGHDAA